SSATAADLVQTARSRSRRLSVVQPALLEPSVRKLETLLDAGRLGDVFYMHGVRHVPDRREPDDPLLWDEGADDVAVALHLLGDEPVEVDAKGECYVDAGACDLLECHLRFATGITVRLYFSVL